MQAIWARARCLQLAVETAERVLHHRVPPPAVCEALRRSFTQAAETNLVPRFLIIDRALSTPLFRELVIPDGGAGDVLDGELDASPPSGLVAFVRFTGFVERDFHFFLGTFKRSIELAQMETPQSLDLTNHINNTCELARENLYLRSPSFLSGYKFASVRHAALQARLRMAATAFAIEMFQHNHGRFPGELQELVPGFLEAVPKDPFDGKPLRYSRLPNGYRLYSIGQDGLDNDGKPELKVRRGPQTPFDIPFKVERLASSDRPSA